MGGSNPGKTRQVKPLGIVRNPNGDYFIGLTEGDDQSKKYLAHRGPPESANTDQQSDLPM